ncbi:MAG: Zn-ribbon domain-containing OB-fold protein [Gemmatimonadetes bacterium]|nr:Zn-ribbon domain-containing OB-fold protein [Gemmatimonadota bacterium]
MTLLERDKNAPQAWHGNLPVTSRYTYGLAGERFFRALKDENAIMGSYCPDCDHTYVPANVFCERCLGELTEWSNMGLVGNLYTFPVLFVGYDGAPLDEPETVGFISFGDGGLVHRIDADPEELFIGMLMQAVLKPKAERKASILDIEAFKPAED